MAAETIEAQITKPTPKPTTESEVKKLGSGYNAAKQPLLDAIATIADAAVRDSVTNSLLKDDSLKLLNGSKLTEQLTEEQNKTKTVITERIAALDEATKKTVSAKLDALHTARLAYARKKQELLQQQRCADAVAKINLNYITANPTDAEVAAFTAMREKKQHIGGKGPDDAESTFENNIMDKLGNETDHLQFYDGEKTNPDFDLHFDNNEITCKTTALLAPAARAKGWKKFTFTKAPSFDKGELLISATEEMLRVGMEEISFDRGVLTLASLMMSSKNKKHFDALKRICDASKSTFQLAQHNNVFDDKAYSHQVATFLRLRSDEDRRTYLDVLKKDNPLTIHKDFVEELHQHGEMFSDGATRMTPKEYFQQKMSLSKEELASLHEDELQKAAQPATAELLSKASAAERSAFFKNIHNQELAQHVWKALDAPKRAEILCAYINQDILSDDDTKRLKIAFKDMNAEELRAVYEHMKNAYTGTDYAKNQNLFVVKSLISKLGGDDFQAVAAQFAPKYFFKQKLAQELPKAINVDPTNTLAADLQARMNCYQRKIQDNDDVFLPVLRHEIPKLKLEIADIVEECADVDLGLIKAYIVNAAQAVFAAKPDIARDVIEFTEDLKSEQERNAWSVLGRA
ncbi:MAG: hypothetical protein M3R00_09085 [Pseudomonadota bacterium]|nr:hypothetical protein [Pseudomonadota bacterium]